MINKTPLGIPFSGAGHGGVHRDRRVLEAKHTGAGQPMPGLHFMAQGRRLTRDCSGRAR